MAVTMDDVARRAGVSRAAVSLAFQDSPRVSPGRRAQILQVAAEMDYQPNVNARRLASGSSGTIGVLLSDLHNQLFAEILDGFFLDSDSRSGALLLASGFNNVIHERDAVQTFLSHRVDAIALIGSKLPDLEIQRLAERTPTVVVGRRVDHVDSVSVDDAAGAELATQHLIDLGHQQIAHIDGGTGSGAALRRSTFQAVMQRANLADFAVVASGDYTEAGGYDAASNLITQDPPPTAIFAANDLSALGALGASHTLATSANGGPSIIGFDNIELARSQYVRLTTIDYPRREMGSRARSLLTDRVKNRDEKIRLVNLAPNLIVRDTTTLAGR